MKAPIPGGGSAAALSAALGAALISMVVRYSQGKGKTPVVQRKLQATLKTSERLRKRFLRLVDLDAQAYLGVVKTRKATKKRKKAALKHAREVPREVCRLCCEAVELTPFLVKEGSKYLLSDVKVALELLLAAFRSAQINMEVNV